ncbi:MAG: amidohydrolase family protein [Candidatus Bathyarchaeia archaeon]
MIIDSWVLGCWTPELRKAYLEHPLTRRFMKVFRLEGEDRVPSKTVEQMVEEMENTGIDKAVLVGDSPFKPAVSYGPSIPPSFGTYEQWSKFADKYPDKFVVCATPSRPGYWDVRQTVREVERAVKDFHAQAINIPSPAWNLPFNSKLLYPVYSKCVELGISIWIWVGIPGPYYPVKVAQVIFLDEIALAFPELKIVAHHIGDPWIQMVTHLAGKYENLYICTCAWSPRWYPSELVNFMKTSWFGTRGSEKVLFGTAYPVLPWKRAVEEALALPLEDEDKRKFLGENALKLFHWG